MNVQDNRDWDFYPEIEIKEDCFTLTIKDDIVEVECDWDYGYGGRGSERIYLSRKKLTELLNLMDETIDKE